MSPRSIALVSLLVATVSATAAIDPAVKCISSRANEAGKAVATILACHAKAAGNGLGVDPACVAKARSRLETKLTAIAATNTCPPTTSDSPAANADYLTARTVAVAAPLVPTMGSSDCQKRKLLGLRIYAKGVFKAHAKHVKQRIAASTGQRALTAFIKGQDKFINDELPPPVGCSSGPEWLRVSGELGAIIDPLAGRLGLVVRETTGRPSTAQPANTPGSPGVPPSVNPKLVAQFGDGTFDLNQVIFTRWRLGGPPQTPDAILVLVPGFGGGAGNFEALAENLVTGMLERNGMAVEVWGFDRRTEWLEDRVGMALAGILGDPLIALDWYYGAELGLTLHPVLADAYNRRAVFYNTTDDVPFIANWTSLVFSRDLDVVVQFARGIARNQNVFLGGHSAGTGFAARYAATDFNLTGVGPADPGYERLRGLVLFEGTGGTTATGPLTGDSLDRMEAKFDGGLFGAVRDGAARCVDGTTGCTVATEAVDCVGQAPPVCTPSTAAHGVILNISPKVLAAAEPIGIQGMTDPDGGQAIIQVDQGAPGNNAVAVVPELALLSVLQPGTVDGLFGSFLDDESLAASLSPALATSVGATGPVVGGLVTWLDRDERALWPACPGTGCVLTNNGSAPTTLPGGIWNFEEEPTRMDRLRRSFAGIDGVNASDWYYPVSGLSVTSAAGVCATGTCVKGNVGATCASDAACNQSISLDSSALSIGRGRRDIENLTQAGNIDIPVLAFGGTNGLVPVTGRFTTFAQSLGTCTAPTCDGTPRVIDPSLPNPAFPTFGSAAGGFEAITVDGFAHIDVVSGDDDDENPIPEILGDFIARNVQ